MKTKTFDVANSRAVGHGPPLNCFYVFQIELYGDELCFQIKDRTLELFDVIKNHSNPVKYGTSIETVSYSVFSS